MEAGDRRASDSPPLPGAARISGTGRRFEGLRKACASFARDTLPDRTCQMNRDPPDKTANRTAHTYVANLAFSQAADERDNHRSMP
jgi:hypothetical protein